MADAKACRRVRATWLPYREKSRSRQPRCSASPHVSFGAVSFPGSSAPQGRNDAGCGLHLPGLPPTPPTPPVLSYTTAQAEAGAPGL